MNTIGKLKLAFVILVFAMPPSIADKFENNSYDNFCGLIGTSLIESPDVDTQHQFILSNFDLRVGDGSLKEAYLFSFQLDSKVRYEEFVKSISSVAGRDWQCESMNTYFKQFEDR